KKFKIKDSVKGVVITGVDASSAAADKRLAAGSTIVAIEQEQVAQPADVQRKVDSLKKAGKKTALLLGATSEVDMLVVARPSERRHPSSLCKRAASRPPFFIARRRMPRGRSPGRRAAP